MLIPNAPVVSEMPKSSNVVPERTYNLRIVKASLEKPKSADAKADYIRVQAVITGPAEAEPCKGRMIFQNYSLSEAGSFRLRELLEVTGHPADFRLTDTDQLVGLEFGAAVVIQAGTNGYPDKNEIKKHVPLV